MYDLGAYGAMIADTVRMSAYEDALRSSVTSDSVVLDIGAGPGIMSLLAAKMGARQVIAVDPNPLIRVGARLAAENGLADRIRFVHGRSQQIELKEKADVVVGDLRGSLPNVPAHIDAIADARRRLMKPGGVLIPLRDTVFVAPVQAEEAFSKLVSPWKDNRFRLSMAGAIDAMVNNGPRILDPFDRLLGPGQEISTLDYLTVESPDIDTSVGLMIEETGVVHGLSIWFETELFPGIGFSTAPYQENTVYGRVFLPLNEATVVEAGDRIPISIKTTLDGRTQLWVWRGRILAEDGSTRAKFALSNAFHNPESEAVREVFHLGCTPAVSRNGGIVRQLLVEIDGNRSVADLTADAMAGFPDQFEYEEDALATVRGVVGRHCDATLLVDD